MRILILLIFVIVFPSACASRPNADGVTITIERVARTLNTEPKNRSTGLVELKFKNDSRSDAEVILASTIGYPDEILSKRGLPLTPVYTGGGDFATVQIEWFKKGINIADSDVKLTGNPMLLKPGECRLVLLPITFPEASGDYELELTFDNRNLKELAETYADHYADISKFFQYRVSKSVRVDKPVIPKSVINK